jgi:hypothetical protein
MSQVQQQLNTAEHYISMLPGVPIVESPFFERILDAGYFEGWEKPIAASLHRKGYAIFDFPDTAIAARAERIKRALAPLFASARQGGEKFDGRLGPPRFQDAFDQCPDVLAIATNESLIALLTKLYGRRTFPFQTLNFERGSQQHPHTDSVHFHSYPERFMCGVWVALEDVTPDNGPLVYYPGSNRWPAYSNEHITARKTDLLRPPSQSHFHDLWMALAETHGCKREIFCPKLGSALIWSANLLHGGEKINDPSTTRWSQVSHYFFDNCAYYTPMGSHLIGGRIAFIDAKDVGTLRSVPSMLAERPLPSEHVAQSRSKMLVSQAEKDADALPSDFVASTYLKLNPDVAEAGVDAVYHFMTHGRFEGRKFK